MAWPEAGLDEMVRLMLCIEKRRPVPAHGKRMHLICSQVVAPHLAPVGGEIDSMQIGARLPFGVHAVPREAVRPSLEKAPPAVEREGGNAPAKVVRRQHHLPVRAEYDVTGCAAVCELAVHEAQPDLSGTELQIIRRAGLPAVLAHGIYMPPVSRQAEKTGVRDTRRSSHICRLARLRLKSIYPNALGLSTRITAYQQIERRQNV